VDLGGPTAPGEIVEAELDRLIEKWATVEDPEAKDALWLRSVERYNARRREENRAARVEYHSGQVVRLRAVLESLITHHEYEAAKLMQDQPKGEPA
jgi:hypothetical protein